MNNTLSVETNNSCTVFRKCGQTSLIIQIWNEKDVSYIWVIQDHYIVNVRCPWQFTVSSLYIRIYHSCIHVLFSSLAAYLDIAIYQVCILCTNSLHHISQPMKLLHSYVYMYRYLHTTWHIESTHTTGTLSFSHFINSTHFYSIYICIYTCIIPGIITSYTCSCTGTQLIH